MSERTEYIGQRESLRHVQKRLEAEALSHRDSLRAALPIIAEPAEIDVEYVLSLALALNEKILQLRGINKQIAVLTSNIDG